jgi:hypothetical protein
MNGLYPIIRRVRRPLLPVEVMIPQAVVVAAAPAIAPSIPAPELPPPIVPADAPAAGARIALAAMERKLHFGPQRTNQQGK